MLPMVRRRLGDVDMLRREFEDVMSRMGWRGDEEEMPVSYPVDIHEDDQCIYVDAELPGFRKEDIDVTLDNNVLRINAERHHEETRDRKHLTERRYTSVQRSLELPQAVSAEPAEAKLDEGVLHLKFNKSEEAKPRKIELK